MADFDHIFNLGLNVMKARIMNVATVHHLEDGTSYTLKVAFNEQVGFIDDIRRAVILLDDDDVTQEVKRGDYFVLDGETTRWYSKNVRIDKIGSYEIRCDTYLLET